MVDHHASFATCSGLLSALPVLCHVQRLAVGSARRNVFAGWCARRQHAQTDDLNRRVSVVCVTRQPDALRCTLSTTRPAVLFAHQLAVLFTTCRHDPQCDAAGGPHLRALQAAGA
jgi:hypothetical protein